MQSGDVTGCRVLVVEDETLIAILVEEILAEMGCQIVGPIAKLETALQTAKDGGFDIAILDVTIRGGKSLPRRRRANCARSAIYPCKWLWRLGAASGASREAAAHQAVYTD
jgi:DNA-binding NarL/FixJ family response regulator